MKNNILLLAIFLIFNHIVFSQSKVIKELDATYAKSMKDWDVPGMGISIVNKDGIIFEKGYGVKSTATKEKVDEHSIFAVASNSKAFTSTALAILVDEGKLQWNQKVRHYLPWFELYDPYVSSEFTIRDLLCHRSGLATFSGDLLWYGSSYSAEEVVRKAKGLKPVNGFREAYGYQNIMFMAAGLIIEEVSGQSWVEFVESRILKPTGMNETLSSITQFKVSTNKAEPHNTKEGQTYPIDWVNWDNVVAAGGLISSAHDFGLWIQLQLNKGKLGEQSVFSEARCYEMQEINTPKPIGNWSRNNFPDKTVSGYGLGWEVWIYKGYKVVSHGGGYDGMISQSFFVPEKGFGGVFLTNSLSNLSYALMFETIERMLGAESSDVPGKLLEIVKQGEENDLKELQEFENARIKNTKPSLTMEDYVGTYTDEYYGDCVLSLNNGKLEFIFSPTPLFQGSLEHWHFDTFRLSWSTKMMLPQGTAQFILDEEGNVTELKIDVPNPDFDFTELKFIRTE